jgi:hypothetical protein
MKHSKGYQIDDILKYEQNAGLFPDEILVCGKKARHSIVLKRRDLPSKHSRWRLRLCHEHFDMMTRIYSTTSMGTPVDYIRTEVRFRPYRM